MKMESRMLSTVVCVALFLMTSCENEEKQHKDWGYKGEISCEHWCEIEENSACSGEKQSPINIIEVDVSASNPENQLRLMYSPETHLKDVVNNGHSIKFDFDTGDSINYRGNHYYLKQIHFHEPSEHTINGIRYPIEIHLVHFSKENNPVVMAVLGMEGKESQLFEFLESFLPLEAGETKALGSQIDLNSLFPDKKDYYSYSGSLTAPPCSEDVNWIIFKQPISLSLKEVMTLKENIPLNNYRPEQPLNGRTVNYNEE